VYCYARNSHEYWGYSAGLDFERKIIVKMNAAELLEKELSNPRHKAEPMMFSGNTDCYQPVERKLGITRKMLEVLLKYRHPAAMVTKNSLICRDMDILAEMAKKNLVAVTMSITGTDEKMREKLEPRTSTYKNRFETLRILSEAGIRTSILFGPVIPGLNSHEIPEVLERAAENGATSAGYTMIRLNGQTGNIFRDWIRKTFPDKAEKVLHHIEGVHGGKVNDTRYGVRMTGEGPMAESIAKLFRLSAERYGLNRDRMVWNVKDFNPRAGEAQLSLF
jgi:DNA repair photolyase